MADKILILVPPKTPRHGIDEYGDFINIPVISSKVLFKSYENDVLEVTLRGGKKLHAVKQKDSYKEVKLRETAYFDGAKLFYKEFLSNLNFKSENIILKTIAPPYPYENVTEKVKKKHIEENFDHEIIAIADSPEVKLILAFSTYASSCLFGNKKHQIGKCEIFETEYKNKPLYIASQGIDKYVVKPSRRKPLYGALSMVNGCIERGYTLKDYRATGLTCEFTYDLSDLLSQDHSIVSFDTETTGLYWHKDDIRVLTVQLAVDEKKSYVVPLCDIAFPELTKETRDKLISQLKTLFSNSKSYKMAHNWSFDYLMIWKKLGIELNGPIIDTEQLLFLWDENLPSKSLAEGCRILDKTLAGYSDEFDKTQDKSNMTRVALENREKFLYYAGLDALATYRLGIKLINLLQVENKKHLDMYFSYYEPAMKALVNNLVKNGVPVDKDKLKSLYKKFKNEIEEIEKDILKSTDKIILQKHMNKGLKLSRDELVRDILFTNDPTLKTAKAGYGLKPTVFTETGFPSVSVGNHLPYFEDNDFIGKYKEYSVLDKMLSTYIGEYERNTTGLFEFIGSDSHLHSGYYLSRTNTGRTSVNSPNVQALPKRGGPAKAFRKCLVSKLSHEKEDWVFLMPDYSQAELRVVAWEAKDDTMIQAYKEGKDLHMITGCKVAGITEDDFFKLSKDEQGLIRYNAKAVNFGECFGAWWTTLQRYAKLSYDVVFTDEEAQNAYNAFFELYSKLKDWHESCIKEAHKYGHIKMLHGRVRTLPDVYSVEKFVRKEAERQSINSRVQGFASDINILALTLLCQDIKRSNLSYIKPCLSIHDQLIFRVHRDKLDDVARAVKFYMEQVPIKQVWGVESPVPFVADMAWGENLAEENKMDHIEAHKPSWCSF